MSTKTVINLASKEQTVYHNGRSEKDVLIDHVILDLYGASQLYNTQIRKDVGMRIIEGSVSLSYGDLCILKA